MTHNMHSHLSTDTSQSVPMAGLDESITRPASELVDEEFQDAEKGEVPLSSGPSSMEDAGPEIPDGGARAYRCLFGAFMISAVCYGVLNSFGVFEEYYRVNQLSDRSLNDISWIGSLQLCLILLTGSISGPLFDAGYFKYLIAFGGSLYVFCLFMTSIASEYYQFLLAQGVGVGFSQGLLFTPSISVLAHHFKRYRNPVFGIHAAGASVGGVVRERSYAPLSYGVTFAVDHGMSQRLAFYSLAILNACSAIGRTIPNFIAQKVGPVNVLIVACTISSISLYVWVTASSNAGILVFNAFFGVFSGTYVSCLAAAAASLAENPTETGLRLGMLYWLTSFFWLVSSPIQGALIRLHHTYWPAAVFSGTCVILGVACIFTTRVMVSKQRGTLRV
ncbi:hypothetical protein VKT23_001581 [Stygiomarasmius scandens]|uniref:MFS general substrate transporter n=1 Tax=Marasmiellus scandens TaxID=2682957 RepID=A0ABR1JZA5_9AGAR